MHHELTSVFPMNTLQHGVWLYDKEDTLKEMETQGMGREVTHCHLNPAQPRAHAYAWPTGPSQWDLGLTGEVFNLCTSTWLVVFQPQVANSMDSPFHIRNSVEQVTPILCNNHSFAPLLLVVF